MADASRPSRGDSDWLPSDVEGLLDECESQERFGKLLILYDLRIFKFSSNVYRESDHSLEHILLQAFHPTLAFTTAISLYVYGIAGDFRLMQCARITMRTC